MIPKHYPLWGIQNTNWFPRTAPDWEREDEEEKADNRHVRIDLSRPVEDEVERHLDSEGKADE